ncbi:MAG: hypothetical protein ABL971_01180 [Vicinamibacterales bacterium]
MATTAAYFLIDIPVQLSDSLQNIFAVDRRALWDLMENNLWAVGYLRPLLFAPIRIVYLLSDGDYTAWFRGVHAAQLTLTIALCVAVMRVRTWPQAAAAPVGLAVLLSMHTFADTIREAFPVNAYLTIVACCLAAVLLARSRHCWWSDPATVLLFVLAAFSAESGLLVWVVVVAAFAAGWRGVSRWGVAATTLGLAGYFILRYLVLDIGTPGLDERATGFGLAVLQPDEIQARFGANPLPFYLYNILASVGSVLFAEPRAGVFWAVRDVLRQELQPWMVVNIVACTAVTVLLVTHVVRGWDRWRRWALDDADRMVVVFVAVMGANATMNLVYTKDVIMSPAGALFGIAAFGALSSRLADTTPSRAGSFRVPVLVVVIALTWGIKTAGVHYSLRDSAHGTRKAWAYADSWLEDQEVDLSRPRERAIKDALMADALWRRPAAPRIQIHWRWPGSWFDTTQ